MCVHTYFFFLGLILPHHNGQGTKVFPVLLPSPFLGLAGPPLQCAIGSGVLRVQEKEVSKGIGTLERGGGGGGGVSIGTLGRGGGGGGGGEHRHTGKRGWRGWREESEGGKRVPGICSSPRLPSYEQIRAETWLVPLQTFKGSNGRAI